MQLHMTNLHISNEVLDQLKTAVKAVLFAAALCVLMYGVTVGFFSNRPATEQHLKETLAAQNAQHEKDLKEMQAKKQTGPCNSAYECSLRCDQDIDCLRAKLEVKEREAYKQAIITIDP